MDQIKKMPFILGGVAVLLFILYNSVFIVDERKQALKLRFGQVIGDLDGYRDPGLYFKVPMIDRIAWRRLISRRMPRAGSSAASSIATIAASRSSDEGFKTFSDRS